MVTCISIGTTVYSTIYAVNGAGLQSNGMRTDGVIVDTTAPMNASSIKYGFNLLLNPSFESDMDQGWIHKGVTVIKDTNGAMYIILKNKATVEQSVVTKPGSKYVVTLHTRPSQNGSATAENHLAIEAPSHHQVLLVHRSQQTSANSLWMKHQVYFTAALGTMTSTLRLSSHGKHSCVEVDDVSVQEMMAEYDDSNDGSNAIHVVIQTHENISSVIASWMLTDAEVPITKYMWAVGYVPGIHGSICKVTT